MGRDPGVGWERLVAQTAFSAVSHDSRETHVSSVAGPETHLWRGPSSAKVQQFPVSTRPPYLLRDVSDASGASPRLPAALPPLHRVSGAPVFADSGCIPLWPMSSSPALVLQRTGPSAALVSKALFGEHQYRMPLPMGLRSAAQVHISQSRADS